MTDHVDGSWARADEAWLDAGPGGALPNPLHRMPVGFGRAPGARNHPADRLDHIGRTELHTLRITVLTEAAPLRRLLPPGVELAEPARLHVRVVDARHVYWLAGRSFQAVLVGTPAVSHRDAEPVSGTYYCARWENQPDNVMTGRDDLGWPAMWADVSGPSSVGPSGFDVNATWFGHRFFEMTLRDLGEATREPFTGEVQMHYKYVPRGLEPGSESSRLVVNDLTQYWSGPAGVDGATHGTTSPRGNLVRCGVGTVRFNPARWEEMPIQHHVVNGIASLRLGEVVEACSVSPAT